MKTTPNVKYISGVEVYLEGWKVPFTNIQISEAEGNFPSAGISFPANSAAMKVLEGTIVQIFGNVWHRKTETYKPSLLFEGKISGREYQRGYTSEGITLRAHSLLMDTMKASIIPSDALMTKQNQNATGKVQANAIVTSSSGGQKPTTNNNPDKKKDKKQKIYEGEFSSFGNITKFSNLSDEFSKALDPKKSKAGKGNYHPLLNDFQHYFETNDLYYGIQALAFKIAPSIFPMPNPEMPKGFQVRAAREAINTFLAQGGQGLEQLLNKNYIITLMECLREFQRYMNYQLLSPAAPSATKFFHVGGNINNFMPTRSWYLPLLESGPPALPNIVFPEQITSLNVSHDMVSELTRLVGKMNFTFTSSESIPEWLSPIHVVPDIDIRQDKYKKIVSDLSTEETYKGINLKTSTYDGIFAKVIFDEHKIKLDGKEEIKPFTQQQVQSDMGGAIREMTLQEYLQLKYATRTANIQTDWNPFRMIGLPGLVFDEGMPSIMGTVSSITTNINAAGSATSTIYFRNCRIINDEYTELFKRPDKDKSNDITNLQNYLINELTQEGVTSADETLYKPELYSFENIGEDVYTYILDGTLGPSKRLLELGKELWSNFSNLKESETQLKTSEFHYDFSILKYIKEKKKDGTVKIKDEILEELLQQWDTPPNEIKYSYLLYRAIINFKKYYSRIKKNETTNIYDFIKNISWRRLTTKDEYYTYLNLSNSPKHFYETKDLDYILAQEKLVDTTTLRSRINARHEFLMENIEYSGNDLAMSFPEKEKTLINIQRATKKLSTEKQILGKGKKAWAKYAVYNDLGDSDKKRLSQYGGLDAVISWSGSSYSPAIAATDALVVPFFKYISKKLLKKEKEYENIKKDVTKKINTLETKKSETTKVLNKINKNKKDMTNKELAELARDESSIFRTYNITRRAHVYYAFKNIVNVPLDGDPNMRKSMLTLRSQ